MTIEYHEDKIAQLIDHIKQIAPHVEALHDLIINDKGCRRAWVTLIELSAAATEMLESVHQQDFMDPDAYSEGAQ